MKITDFFLDELRREAERSKRALELVPDGKFDWKPHDRSMAFGYIAMMVATIPDWIVMEINQAELDIAPKDGGGKRPDPPRTSAALLRELDRAVAAATDALKKTTDAHLETNWRLLAGGQVVWEGTRREIISDTFLHLAHHRGQMTVYLRLMGATVPALFGPSADDKRF